MHDVNYIVGGLFVMQKESQECNDNCEVKNASSSSCIAFSKKKVPSFKPTNSIFLCRLSKVDGRRCN